MNFEINTYPYGERPKVELPSPEFLRMITEEGLRKMVSDHYNLLANSEIKHLFPSSPEGLEEAKKHSADFFIQICGGPRYFDENRGNPMLIKRHAPFKITPSARLVWLNCYKQVLSAIDLPDPVLASYWNYINVFSAWMVNTPE
jgi:hemoglobin